jgi:hypothetical protein
MNCVSGLRFAVRQKHIETSRMAIRESVPLCHLLDPLEVRPVDHDVDVFRVPHCGWFDAVHLHHHGAAADQLIRDLPGGKRRCDPLQRAYEGKQAFLKQDVDRPAFLKCVP